MCDINLRILGQQILLSRMFSNQVSSISIGVVIENLGIILFFFLKLGLSTDILRFLIDSPRFSTLKPGFLITEHSTQETWIFDRNYENRRYSRFLHRDSKIFTCDIPRFSIDISCLSNNWRKTAFMILHAICSVIR